MIFHRLPDSPLVRHTGIRFLQNRSLTVNNGLLFKDILIQSPSQSRIGCHISLDYILCVVYKKGRIITVPMGNNRYLKTCLSYSNSKSCWLIGNVAYQENKLDNPYVYDLEHFIGKKYSDIEDDIKLNKWNFEICNDGDNIEIIINNKTNTKYDIIALLNVLYGEAVTYSLKYSPYLLREIVITAPSYFTDEQCNILTEPLKLYSIIILFLETKLFLKGIVKEPIAGLIGYYYTKGIDIEEGYYCVITLEKRRLNICLLNVDKDKKCKIVYDSKEINLGGEMVDNNIYNYYYEEMEKNGLKELPKYREKVIYNEIEECRVMFYNPNCKEYTFMNSIFEKYEIESTISYAYYSSINRQYKKSFKTNLENTFQSDIDKNQIKNIIICGEYGRILFIKEILSDYFMRPIELIEPEEIIAIGATIIN